MKLSQELSKIFKEEIENVIQKEIDDPKYLPQEEFSSCGERATAMIKDAMAEVEKVLAGAIATHRIEAHKEPRENEREGYIEGLSDERTEIALSGWWIG